MIRRFSPVLFVAVAGCYGYYPVSGPAPAGHDVQVTLTDSGSVVLASLIGPSAEMLNGRLVADSGRAIVLAMSSVHQRDGGDTDWKGEHVEVPKVLTRSVEERRFSVGRTTLFSGALAVALVSLRQAFQGTGASTGGSGLPGGGTRK